MARISDLRSGQVGKVVNFIGGNGYYRQRLISEGIVPGALFKVQWIAPLGDPIVVHLLKDKHSFSIRATEAEIVEVELN